MISPGIKILSKMLVETNDPAADLLLETVDLGTGTTSNLIEFIRVPIPATPLFIDTAKNEFFKVHISGAPGERREFHPVHSYKALSLAERHNQGYYYLDGKFIYYAIPSDALWSGASSLGLTVKHYTYRIIDDSSNPFPDELEGHLIRTVTELIQNEWNKQKQEKNEV